MVSRHGVSMGTTQMRGQDQTREGHVPGTSRYSDVTAAMFFGFGTFGISVTGL